MRGFFVKTCFAFGLLSLYGCAAQSGSVISTKQADNNIKNNNSLVLATWNAEHLALPSEKGCKPRDAQQIEQLKAYAEAVNADVFALQEVSSKEAVEQVFPASTWQVIMSAREDSPSYECRGSGNTSTQQKVAFAIRKSVPVDEVINYRDLASGLEGLRYGLGVKIDGPDGNLELLNVHLKSGCFVDDYSVSDSTSCQTFAQQASWLNQWMGDKQKRHQSYVVLGDFNHRISAPYNRFTRMLNAGEKAGGAPAILTRDILGCHPRYPAPIDHIVAGGTGTENFADTKVHYFEDNSEQGMLSDHCAISTTLAQSDVHLPESVKWFRQSKEYQLLTKAIYLQATQSLSERQIDVSDWVVVMDVDETILDNSQYQYNLSKTGQSFTPETWADWVRSENAGLIPGVKGFIDAVLRKGGKLGLVTNRPKSLDGHTWANLRALGIDVNIANTCLMGRSEQDKKAMDGKSIVNDKDLRRQQLSQGKAACFDLGSDTQGIWQSGHKIVMQVGDNIEDINLVTQEHADTDSLLERWKKDIVILPNPMYGSWN